MRVLDSIRKVLATRHFNSDQIEKVIPSLGEELLRRPECLAEVVDTWNILMGRNINDPSQMHYPTESVPALARPPKSSILDKSFDIDMTHILADVEPSLLRLDPKKLIQRHTRVKGLGLTHNLGEDWLLLFNSAQGFYLQEWVHLTKKIYYIESNVLALLYDKKELKEMTVHPLVKAAKAVELDFNVIRLRYLFAHRSGFRSLSHLFNVQTAQNRPSLKELLLSSNNSYLDIFAPYCSLEEYRCFSDLVRNYELDEDDAEIYQGLAELNALSHTFGKKALEDSSYRRASHDEERFE